MKEKTGWKIRKETTSFLRVYLIGKNVKIKFVKDRPGHDLRYALNNKKILTSLGWKAKIPLSVGLSETFDWYLNNKTFFNSVSKKLYINRMGLKKW